MRSSLDTVGRAVVTCAMLLCATLVGAAATAQITTGSVAGTVKDAQGGVIPGATVTLISETKQFHSSPVTTNGSGDFVFPSVTVDTYTVQVEMPSFKTLNRSGIVVSPGTRASAGVLTIEVGGTSETVVVTGEAPLVQSTSGERSFSVSSTQIENLPVASRSFQAFATLTPGVNGTDRIGGGGGTQFMMDGVVTMDAGSGTPALQVGTESVAEVKVLTSSYQAEYGRASGIQITAVTKSGTNQFRGSVYDIERNSDWNANSNNNILQGFSKTVAKQRDWGFSLGGPIGKAGGSNKLFFFYAQEFNPRQAGNDVVQFRMPTALERKGDFSQTYDNNGALYPYIKDPNKTGTCSAASQVACFADGGVTGRIPQASLYSTGLAILNWWPTPNIDGTGLAYNYQLTRPVESALGYQPVIRGDYQPTPKLRLTGKFTAYAQRHQSFAGPLPGFTDSELSRPYVPTYLVSGTYSLSPTTFFEGTTGRTNFQNEGCSFTGGGSPGPNFCTAAIATTQASDMRASGFADLPTIFPQALVIDPRYHAYDIFNQMQPPYWDGQQVWRAPTFAFGSRVANAPPASPFPGFFQSGGTRDVALSLTKVSGHHTFKFGYYFQHELHTRNGGPSAFGTLSFAQDTVGTNPFDTSYGFANVATGAFSSFTQGSKYLEGHFIYNQHEFYAQDNWKVNAKLSLDYGMRFVNEGPYYDADLQTSNFLPEQWNASAAPVLYVAGCANGAATCTGTNRQAKNPQTGAFLGPTSSTAIGTLVPSTGNLTNGLGLTGKDIVKTNYKWPLLGVAPRIGFAYDLTGRQRFVLRGGGGIYYDRPSANAAGTYNMIGNPPIAQSVTIRFGQLQGLNGGLKAVGAPALQSNTYVSPLPASAQFNASMQMALPWAVSVDVGYVGQHSYNTIQSLNLNALDFGTAFLASTNDPTSAPTTNGSSSYAATSPDLLRSFQGYSAITHRFYNGWRTYHSIQASLNRRFRNGLSFGFNDTIGLSDTQNVAPRLVHSGPGQFAYTSDMAEAQALLGDNNPVRHTMKANFVWDLPDLHQDSGMLQVLAAIVNDWQVSGIWTGSTASYYTVSFSYQSGGSSVNLTGSPDYSARVVVAGDPGGGCTSDVYRQFNTAAFLGPLQGSVGLESGTGYLKGCFQSTLDLSLARSIRLNKGRSIQLRLDMFNAPNSAIITGRQTTMNLTSPADRVTVTNLPYDANGNLIPSKALPNNNAGFGVVTGYQAPRSLQAQIRFSF